MAAKYRWLLRIANGMICPAYHVRPLRGLSTLSSCYPRSLSRLGFRRLQPKLVRRPGVIHSVTPSGVSAIPTQQNQRVEPHQRYNQGAKLTQRYNQGAKTTQTTENRAMPM